MSIKRHLSALLLQEKAMPQASLKTCEKLFEVIFPGEDFSLKKVPELASAVKALSEDVIKQHGEVMPPSGPGRNVAP